MTELEFNHLAAAVLALWPRSAWPEATVNIARSMLTKLDYAHVSKAVADLAKEGREYAPPPGVIYIHARGIEREARPRLSEPETSPSDWDRARAGVTRIRQAIQELAEQKRSSTGGRPS